MNTTYLYKGITGSNSRRMIYWGRIWKRVFWRQPSNTMAFHNARTQQIMLHS